MNFTWPSTSTTAPIASRFDLLPRSENAMELRFAAH